MVLGVSFDSLEDNKHFAEKFTFPFKLLSDTTRDIGVRYGAADSADAGAAKRIAYVIGPDQKIKTVWAKASPKTFVDEALAAL